MWLVSSLELRAPGVVAAEAPEFSTRALVADGLTLCDGIELVRWADPGQHLRHCDYCGGDDWQGDWVMMRRSGERVLLLPAFNLWKTGPGANAAPLEYEMDEHAPPAWMAERGIAVIRHTALARLVEGLPAPEALPPFDEREAALALQFESRRLLGRFPQVPAPIRELFVTGSEPSLDEALDELERTLHAMQESRRPVELVEQTEGEVWFWVEDANGPSHGRDFKPLARRGGELLLRFEPGLLARPR